MSKIPLNLFSKTDACDKSNLAETITPSNIVEFLNEILLFKNSLPSIEKLNVN